MKKILTLLSILLLLVSCNFSSVLPPEAYIDDGTWSGVFKGFWHGMNSNYIFWNIDSPSYEWDRVYDEYLPKFVSLGSIDYNNKQTTQEAIYLILELTSENLSDGHLSITVKNGVNDKESFRFNPLLYKKAKEHSNKELRDIFNEEYSAKEKESPIYKYLPEEMKEEEAKTILERTFKIKKDLKAKEHLFLTNIETGLQGSRWTLSNELDDIFSTWLLIYSPDYQCLLGVTKDNAKINDTSISGNTIYLLTSAFLFYEYLNPETGEEDYSKEMMDIIAELSREKQREDISALILDMRGNIGGYNSDRNYIFSNLVEENLLFGYQLNKVGNNRLDYAPYLPLYIYKTKGKVSPLKDKPIIALVNNYSVSNAELTALIVKKLPKGVLIGGKTYGATGTLNGDNKIANAGEFSLGSYITQVYTPYAEIVDENYISYEGVGIDVDVNVPYTLTLDKDARLEAAFEYIKQHP